MTARLLFVACLLLAASFARAASTPTVLLCTWAGHKVDPVYAHELEQAGFRIDRLDAWKDFSAAKIGGYNAIVLFSFPTKGIQTEDPLEGPDAGPNYEQTMAAVKDYLAKGGGVIFTVDAIYPHAIDEPAERQMLAATQDALAEFGAKVTYESVAAPPAQSAVNARLMDQPYYYANEVLPSPVSDGVRGAWLPTLMRGQDFLWSGPIIVDGNWTPVLRAGRDVTTGPNFLTFGSAAADPAHTPGLITRDPPEHDPLLVAVREVGPGRLALFHLAPSFYIEQGTAWFYHRATIDEGFNGVPSDFGRLFLNLLHWTTAPSLASGKVGGATIPADRLTPPALRSAAREALSTPASFEPDPLAPVKLPRKLLRGFLGARTALTGGQGSVDDYARAAHDAHLDFVIFLEDLTKLDDAKLAQLQADCRRLSSKDFLLLPGYSVPTNVGPKLFVFGRRVILPKDAALWSTIRPGTFALEAEDGKGGYTDGSASLGFVFKENANTGNTESNLGYFDFGASLNDGRFRLPQARAFGGAGVLYYKDGKLVEDLTHEYLETNGGTMSCVPLVIAEVTSPQAMRDHVAAGRALTYGVADDANALPTQALRWNNQYDNGASSVSDGPTIAGWSNIDRVLTYGNEDFAGDRAIFVPSAQVHSDAGLREVCVYDGTRLVRRFLPNGAKDYPVRLYLSAALQANLSLVAVDVNGHRAVTFPSRTYKDDRNYCLWCGDHINEGGGSESIVKAARGEFWPFEYSPASVPNAGTTWDGGPMPLQEIFTFSETSPSLQFAGMPATKAWVSTPFMDCIDERVYRGGTEAIGQLLAPGNCWTGYGPIGALDGFDCRATLTLFRQAVTGTSPTRDYSGLHDGSMASLFEETTTFTRDATLKEFSRMGYKRGAALPGTLLIGRGHDILTTVQLPRDKPMSVELPHGAWLAAISSRANSLLTYNRGDSLTFDLDQQSSLSRLTLPATGRPVKNGDQIKLDLFTTSWPMSESIADQPELLRTIDYLANPPGMKAIQGHRETSDGGLQEFTADRGVVEISMPRADSGALQIPATELAVRVDGLNPNWTAGEYQLNGYVGGNYYSQGAQVWRPIGVEPRWRAYAPLYVSRADVHTLLGHPVIADGAGKDLMIQVTALKSPHDGAPGEWHVSVNNPTDHAITATLERRLDLPGLKFTRATLTLAPGSYRILEQGDTDPARFEKSSWPALSAAGP